MKEAHQATKDKAKADMEALKQQHDDTVQRLKVEHEAAIQIKRGEIEDLNSQIEGL